MAETPVPKTLAQWRASRDDMTQFDLAVKSGVSLYTIAGVEGKRHDIGVTLARKLAAALGVRVDDIIWPSDDEVARARERRRAKKEAA